MARMEKRGSKRKHLVATETHLFTKKKPKATSSLSSRGPLESVLYFFPVELVDLILEYNMNVLRLPIFVELNSYERLFIREKFSRVLVEKEYQEYRVCLALIELQSRFPFYLEMVTSRNMPKGEKDLHSLLHTIIEQWQTSADMNGPVNPSLSHLTDLCMGSCHIHWETSVNLTPFFHLIMWIFLDAFYQEDVNARNIQLPKWFELTTHVPKPDSCLPALFLLDVETCKESLEWQTRHPGIVTEEDADLECWIYLRSDFFMTQAFLYGLSLESVKKARRCAIVAVHNSVLWLNKSFFMYFVLGVFFFVQTERENMYVNQGAGKNLFIVLFWK